MDTRSFLLDIADPALAWLATSAGTKSNDRARVLVLTIAGQESNWQHRRQIGGPARGFWQFELGGGVDDVFRVTGPQLQKVCASLDIPFDPRVVFEAMAWNDRLAGAMARLLLYVDPRPLPDVGDVVAGWQYYLRNWRPGAPHPDVWPGLYAKALAAMGAPVQQPSPAAPIPTDPILSRVDALEKRVSTLETKP